MKVRIRTPSRIHITLIDLNGSIGRIDGGVGLALRSPWVEVVAREGEDVRVEGECINLERFKWVASMLKDRFGMGIELRVLNDYEPHVGLGSGTQISLATAMAYNILYGLGLSVRGLAEITGRGGTSGIGVAAFEFGGFIVDGGHSVKEKPEFLPSSASKARPAPVVVRLDFPDWKVVLAVPDMKGFHGRREVDLFKTQCPIPVDEVREICHLILMKMLPSIVEEDLDGFGDAILSVQRMGFKRREIDMYGGLIRRVIDDVSDLTKAVGMSSTGPTVYAITDANARDVELALRDSFESMGVSCRTLITKAKNSGADVIKSI